MAIAVEYPRPHAVSVDEFMRMGKANIFAPDARLELIEGGILEMAPIGSPHSGAVNTLTKTLVRFAGDAAVVAVQNPLVLGNFSMPQPDLLLLKPRADHYSARHPTASDVLLLIEVADSTLTFDQRTKVPLYASHGIVEVWIVDVNAQTVSVYRNLHGGSYQEQLLLNSSDMLTPTHMAGLQLPVSAVFPR